MKIMGKDLFQVMLDPVMLVLLAASVTALALVIERFIYFRRNRCNTATGVRELRRQLSSGGLSAGLQWAQNQNSPMGRMFVQLLENATLDAEELADLSYSLIIDERIKFEHLLGGMGTLANAATLLGLLGTVTGLINSFNQISVTKQAGPDVVAGGIAVALLTTAWGLGIGIPTLFAYNYFNKKSSDLAMQLEAAADRVIVMLGRARSRAGSKAAETAPAPGPRPAEDTGWRF
ncbi:MotA/TolQ/ExbB proton channel family protein [candidate division WOR-3 bacterium]|uniref:MotA/TolQ/ExbB proton channel family protein n=1 Tax=candidate division WOR-3 bacterium TaxID=2052148 RepID=A0A938BSC3_UNCW3|nr:MotA/TolQ/ExbB proton channel family protein [candidate division WOR-3 bacterium]